jgi:hypothetical protein
MYTTNGTYYTFRIAVCRAGWIVPIQPARQIGLDTPETCRI